METFVARQPIFDRDQKVYAYELLFRDSMDNFMPEIDSDTATSHLLKNSFLTIGVNELCGGHHSFINFTDHLLIKRVPLLLPRDSLVVEILEDVEITEELIAACRELARAGYIIALDDFVYSPDFIPLLEIADIIKFDFRISTLDEIRSNIDAIAGFNLRLLAEKIENQEEFATARKLGFELFQGYFFCRPEIIRGREIPAAQLALLELVSAVNQEDFDCDELEAIINRDLGLSYRLLRYINSPFFAKAHKISAIRQAIAYLGHNELRRFVALSSMAELSQNKPDELLRLACIRARFCELLGEISHLKVKKAELFTVGLFSLLDAIIDQPMAEIIKKLPLSNELVRALTERKGRLAAFLVLAIAYEKGRWRTVEKLASRMGID
ncbi:MAG: HDOD domain-containing protein, partial [Deltaproteobacteria bacterium]|nr:HDOD domain-containing protein [Deltaproteobacteria bacterium]